MKARAHGGTARLEVLSYSSLVSLCSCDYFVPQSHQAALGCKGCEWQQFGAICLEPQLWPDAVCSSVRCKFVSLSLYISLRRQCGPRFFRRRREAPKTQSFRASTEDAKLQRRGASELQPKTRSSEDAELQKRRREASELQLKTRSSKDAELHSVPEDAELHPKTRSSEDAELQSFTRRREAPKTRSFRASPKTRSSEGAELQSFNNEDAELQSFNRRREAPKTRSFKNEDAELQSFNRRPEDAELQSFKSFRSFKAKAKTRSFRASKLQNDSGTTLPMRSYIYIYVGVCN